MDARKRATVVHYGALTHSELAIQPTWASVISPPFLSTLLECFLLTLPENSFLEYTSALAKVFARLVITTNTQTKTEMQRVTVVSHCVTLNLAFVCLALTSREYSVYFIHCDCLSSSYIRRI